MLGKITFGTQDPGLATDSSFKSEPVQPTTTPHHVPVGTGLEVVTSDEARLVDEARGTFRRALWDLALLLPFVVMVVVAALTDEVREEVAAHGPWAWMAVGAVAMRLLGDVIGQAESVWWAWRERRDLECAGCRELILLAEEVASGYEDCQDMRRHGLNGLHDAAERGLVVVIDEVPAFLFGRDSESGKATPALLSPAQPATD